MMANSLLQTGARSYRETSSGVASALPANDDAIAPSVGSARRHASGSAQAAVHSNPSDLYLLAAKALADFARVSDGTSSGHRRAAPCKAESQNFRAERDAFARAFHDDDGSQIIFVVLTPKGVPVDQRFEAFQRLPLASAGVERHATNFAERNGRHDDALQRSAVGQESVNGFGRSSVEPAVAKSAAAETTHARFRTLTRRERDVLQRVLAGHPNKNIAADLHISQRTVENHRAKVMRKTGSRSLPALVSLAIAAGEMPNAASTALR